MEKFDVYEGGSGEISLAVSGVDDHGRTWAQCDLTPEEAMKLIAELTVALWRQQLPPGQTQPAEFAGFLQQFRTATGYSFELRALREGAP